MTEKDSMVEEFLRASEEVVVPNDATLCRVRDLIRLQLDLEDQIKALSVQVEAAKAALARVQEIDLPSSLQEYGMAEIRMEDGTRVTVKQEYYASIKEEKKGEAFGWLIDNFHGDLIKHDLITSFTKGMSDEARRVMELLDENNIEYVDKKHVHPQTLRAFVREQIEAGNPIPLETFGVHVRQVARIKREK